MVDNQYDPERIKLLTYPMSNDGESVDDSKQMWSFLTRDLADEIDRLAEEEFHTTRSEFLRMLLVAGLNSMRLPEEHRAYGSTGDELNDAVRELVYTELSERGSCKEDDLLTALVEQVRSNAPETLTEMYDDGTIEYVPGEGYTIAGDSR